MLKETIIHCVVALFIAPLLGGVCSRSEETHVTSQIFSYQDAASGHTEVFDFRRRLLVTGGDDILLDPAHAESEFSGPLRLCSDKNFYCLSTGLHLAIPRGPVPRSWEIHGLSCTAKQIKVKNSDNFQISCKSSGGWLSTRIMYSTARGVLSYQRICKGCHEATMRLLGVVGMFKQ